MIINSDQSRLRCFEEASEQQQTEIRKEPFVNKSPAPRSRPSTIPAQPQSKTAIPLKTGALEPIVSHTTISKTETNTKENYGLKYRAQAGVGYGTGTHSGFFGEKLGGTDIEVHLDSTFGGSGEMAEAAIWVDGIGWNELSLGVEYIYAHIQSEIDGILPSGASILTDPISFPVAIDVKVHNLFINAAWRPVLDNRIAPYLGAGLGGAFGIIQIKGSISSAFLGASQGSFRGSGGAPALQAFMGIDFLQLSPFYIGVNSHFIYYSGIPFGVKHEFRQFSAFIVLGWQI